MSIAALRTFEEADNDAVVGLSLRAWAPVFASFERELGDAIYRQTYPDWRRQQADAVRAALASNATWVAEVDGRVAGFVNVVFDESALAGEIYMIAVDPDAQGQGIAATLTSLALDEMRRRGMKLATVSTGGDPGHAPARRVYERAGFVAFPQVFYSKIIDGS